MSLEPELFFNCTPPYPKFIYCVLRERESNFTIYIAIDGVLSHNGYRKG